jgi:hypothetical protein
VEKLWKLFLSDLISKEMGCEPISRKSNGPSHVMGARNLCNRLLTTVTNRDNAVPDLSGV